MQVIANAEQAFRVRNTNHSYTENLDELIGITQDLQSLPRCPADSGEIIDDDYTVTINDNGTITIYCNCDADEQMVYHNTVGDETTHGYTPGKDSE